MQQRTDYTEALNKYAACMEEIKLRTTAISFILKGERNTGYKYTNTEFVCLQFRKILELIALANLVSNKEEYAKKHANFANHYHAKHILKDIEKINSNYYPIPTRQIIDEKTGKVKEVKNIEHGYLTKDEFVQIYDTCSGLMHAENPFAIPNNLDQLSLNFPIWLSKIMTLLNHHQVQLVDTKLQIWVVMQGSKDGRVQTTLFEMIGRVGEVNIENINREKH